MGNSPTRHESNTSSFRENSKQYHEYRALENKIRLLKIQANNYNGKGRDGIYTDMFASVQDTMKTVGYLRDKSKSSNRKIEYDMLDAELKNCLQILSSKIHQNNEPKAVGRPEQNLQHEQKSSGSNAQMQYALDSFESRIKQLKNNCAQLSNANQNSLNQVDATGKGLYKELDNLVAPNSSKKLYLREVLQDVLNDIASKQLDLYRKSRYDNLELSSEPNDPTLALLFKMEKSLSMFRDKTYLTSDNTNTDKMIDTLNCYKNDLNNITITNKDVNQKQDELLGFVDSTIKFLKESPSTSNQKSATDKPQQQYKEEPLMKSIQQELSKLQIFLNENSTNMDHLKRILDLLQQVNYSLQHKSIEGTSRNSEYISPNRGSTDDIRKAAAKTTLQIALERKGYRKTFLANTMIKQHAAKIKQTSAASSDIPRPDYPLIDEEHHPQGSADGHKNSMNLGSEGHPYNSLPKNGPPQQTTPNSDRRHDNRPPNKALEEIEAIRRALNHLRNRVDKFNDSRQSGLYEELETLLLELLVRLENVQGDSRAVEATDILVYAIRDTQQVLYILDEKALKYQPPNKYAH